MTGSVQYMTGPNDRVSAVYDWAQWQGPVIGSVQYMTGPSDRVSVVYNRVRLVYDRAQ